MEKQARLDIVFMNMAKEVATLSYCVRTKVGAVIVRDGNVISFGYNGMPSGMDNCCEERSYVPPGTYAWVDHVDEIWTEEDEVGRYKLETKREVLHAESNAILKAAKTGISTNGSTLYLTMSPCIDCSKLIIQAGIKRVVYLQEYRDISGLAFLKDFVEVQQLSNEV
ncbi:MAG: CMP deaminase [Proteobacteria bacterium]|nr:CMP deaminase [Pseudomonadota bacterium]